MTKQAGQEDFGAPPVWELLFLSSITLATLLLLSFRSSRSILPWIPDQPLSILFGGLFGVIGLVVHSILGNKNFRDSFEIEDIANNLINNFSGIFFEFCLPPIIFASSYGIKRRAFFKNLLGIICFAVFGTIISTFSIGFGVFWTYEWLSEYDLSQKTKTIENGEMPLSDALILGALLSAVDPVATLSVLPTEDESSGMRLMGSSIGKLGVHGFLRVNRQIHALIFGENVLNAAVAVIMFNRLADLHVRLRKRADDQNLNFTDVAITGEDYQDVFSHFFIVFIGSVFLGVFMGLLASLSLKNLSKVRDSGETSHLAISPGREQAIMLLFAYVSYALAKFSTMSPVMTLFMTGATMSHYAFYNISPLSQIATASSFSSIAAVAETLVFIFMGLTFCSIIFQQAVIPNLPIILILIVLCNVSRLIHIVLLSNVVNCINYIRFIVLGSRQDLQQANRFKKKFDRTYINFNAQLFLSWVGLRGAVSFALALHAPVLKEKSVIITVSMAVILFSYIINGGSSRLVYQKLCIPDEEEIQSSIKETNTSSGVGNPFNEEEETFDTPLLTTNIRYGSIMEESNSPKTKAIFREMANDHSLEELEEYEDERSFWQRRWSWKRIDDVYIKPVFGGNPRERKKKKRQTSLQ